jgi:ubiquinone/menaquinone biosynthesis C-methylase UbiE
MNTLQKNTIESFNTSANEYTNKFSNMKNYDKTYDFLIDRLNDGDKILDLACGPGIISNYIAKKGPYP